VYTPKDDAVLAWIGGLGAAGVEHVRVRFALSRSGAYARLSRLVDGGLLEKHTLLHRQPSLYVATREGLRSCGMERLRVFRVGPGGYRHAVQVARVTATLQPRLPGWQVMSERELRVVEADEGRLVGSAKLSASCPAQVLRSTGPT
jgi:hypothetical protein